MQIDWLTTVLLVIIIVGGLAGAKQFGLIDAINSREQTNINIDTGNTFYNYSSAKYESDFVVEVLNSTHYCYSRNSTVGEYEMISDNATLIFESCINELPNGGVIHIKHGVYDDVAVQITTSNLTIFGDGMATKLVHWGNKIVIHVYGTAGHHLENVVVANLFVEGKESYNLYQRGIEFQYCDFCVIDHCFVENSGYDNFLFVDDCFGCMMINSFSKNASDDGFNICGCDRCSIISCYSSEEQHDSFHLSMGAHGCIVQDSISINTAQYGIQLYPNPPSCYNVVSDNIIRNAGIDGIFINNSDFNSILGNIIESSSSYSVHARDSDFVEVSNNQISYGMRGVYFFGCKYSIVSDNKIFHPSDYGITLTGSHDNSISDNIIRLTGASDGIYLCTNSYCNIINDNYVTNCQRGIVIKSGCNYNMLVGDYCRDNTDVGITDNGANTEIHSCFNGTSWIN